MPHEALWFEYDWIIDGTPARFAVDLALAKLPREDYPRLIYISCSSRSKKHEKHALTAFEAGRAEAIRKRIIKTIDPLYAGYVETGLERLYYFYCGGQGKAGAVKQIAAKENIIDCQFGTVKELRWTTYDKFLYPGAAKLQTEENRKRIEQMRQRGDDIFVVRRVVFYMFFPSEQAMTLYAERARVLGFAIGESIYAPEYTPAQDAGAAPEQDVSLPHGVELYKLTTLLKPDIDALTTLAIDAAQDFGGEMRYWISPMGRTAGAQK